MKKIFRQIKAICKRCGTKVSPLAILHNVKYDKQVPFVILLKWNEHQLENVHQ